MKILVYPSFTNPYQSLLYNEIKKNVNITITYLDSGFYQTHYLFGLIFFPFRLIYYRLKGYSIFHLHWQHFQVPFPLTYLSYLLSTLYAICVLAFIKLLGYKLIWTVHNITPHERLFINDLWITKIICSFSSKLIVHSDKTKTLLVQLGTETNKIKIIPQGNYIGVYPNQVTRNQARNYFKIPQNEFVLLFFGILRKYKGIEDLITVFKKVHNMDNTRLIIAGECLDENYRKELIQLISKSNNKIIYWFEHISDDKIQYYFNASDIVIFPFTRITNSSSVILSFSFGKPVIAPLLGGLTDLPEDVGYLYNDKRDIVNMINQAMANLRELEKKSTAALEYARSLSWEVSAQETYKVYRQVLKR